MSNIKIPIIHPEYYMGDRGLASARFLINQFIKNEDNLIPQEIISEFNLKSEIAQKCAIYQRDLWCNIKKTKKIYAVSKDFFSALSKVRSKIPSSLLPERFVGYVAFPMQEDFYYKDLKIGGFYIDFKKSDFTFLVLAHSQRDYGISMFGNLASVKLADKDGSLYVHENIKSESVWHYNMVYAALNIMVYIHSSEPDISWLAPKSSMSKKLRKEHINRGNHTSDNITVPIRLVSWNWMKEPTYRQDEWSRKMHLRWQRYGPNNSKAKLIWIKETTVKRKLKGSDRFTKDEENTGSSNQKRPEQNNKKFPAVHESESSISL